MRLTPNQAELLRLLAAGPRTPAELAACWPSRSAEGIARTAASLAALGAAARHPAGPWVITRAGRRAAGAAHRHELDPGTGRERLDHDLSIHGRSKGPTSVS